MTELDPGSLASKIMHFTTILQCFLNQEAMGWISGARITEVKPHTKVEPPLTSETLNNLFLEITLHCSLGAGVLLSALEMSEASRRSQGSYEQ